jgi:hypothetical protein
MCTCIWYGGPVALPYIYTHPRAHHLPNPTKPQKQDTGDGPVHRAARHHAAGRGRPDSGVQLDVDAATGTHVYVHVCLDSDPYLVTHNRPHTPIPLTHTNPPKPHQHPKKKHTHKKTGLAPPRRALRRRLRRHDLRGDREALPGGIRPSEHRQARVSVPTVRTWFHMYICMRTYGGRCTRPPLVHPLTPKHTLNNNQHPPLKTNTQSTPTHPKTTDMQSTQRRVLSRRYRAARAGGPGNGTAAGAPADRGAPGPFVYAHTCTYMYVY